MMSGTGRISYEYNPFNNPDGKSPSMITSKAVTNSVIRNVLEKALHPPLIA